jgi:hypothetical protein
MTETMQAKNPLWEAVKEPLRILVLAIIPFGVAYLAKLPYEWAGIATFILNFIDDVLHEKGKIDNNANLIKGLTRF